MDVFEDGVKLGAEIVFSFEEFSSINSLAKIGTFITGISDRRRIISRGTSKD